VYTLLGQVDEALACLERAAKLRRSFTVARARIEPELAALHGESRFQQLIA
jgi:hypothetical protein